MPSFWWKKNLAMFKDKVGEEASAGVTIPAQAEGDRCWMQGGGKTSKIC